jgi:hypothetical protein
MNQRLRNIGLHLVFTAIYMIPILMKDKYLKVKSHFVKLISCEENVRAIGGVTLRVLKFGITWGLAVGFTFWCPFVRKCDGPEGKLREKQRKIYLCLELNPYSSVMQFVFSSLYRLSYPGS